jgi:hypothetical protein
VTGHRVLRALKPSNWLLEAVVVIVVVLVSRSAVSGWRSADTANVFPESLMTIPTVKPATGYTTLTAPSLMRSQPGHRIFNVHVNYVAASIRSTGPFVVSVHPIDSTTWAAVALGSDQRCYGLLATEARADYETYYTRFPVHTPCRGDEASSITVRSGSPS